MTETQEKELSNILSDPKFGYGIGDHHELCKALFAVGVSGGFDIAFDDGYAEGFKTGSMDEGLDN